ncbi:hypothetical protein MTO96_018789, partial [Rhipicephalus appendiculatus]
AHCNFRPHVYALPRVYNTSDRTLTKHFELKEPLETTEASAFRKEKKNMHLKVILVGLTIFGLIVAESGATPASTSAQEAESRSESEPVERAEQSSAEEARISEACMASLCG